MESLQDVANDRRQSVSDEVNSYCGVRVSARLEIALLRSPVDN